MHFNDRIKIILNSTETDSLGFPLSNAEKEFSTCFCRYVKKSGTELLRSDATVSKEQVVFTVRYGAKTKLLLSDPEATKKYAVIFNNTEYNIKSITDFNNSHMYIDLLCELIS